MFAAFESTNTEPCTGKRLEETLLGTCGSRVDGASTPALGEKTKKNFQPFLDLHLLKN